MPFASLGLSPPLVDAVARLGHVAPTAVQVEAIPAVLRGGDVWASAETGSGKTAAFVLPLLERLSRAPRRTPRPVRVLVLAPTRELAIQIETAFAVYGQGLAERLKTVVVVGGVSENPQMMALRGGADIMIATPGRLLDLLDHRALKLSTVSMLVLDEADRLFDLGFADELGRIFALLPAARQNLLFSATFPDAVRALAEDLLRAPVRIEAQAEPAGEPTILQRAIEVDAGRRTQLLRHLLVQEGWARVLVFVATKHAAEIVADKLRKAGIGAEPLHGVLSQGKRTQVLTDFKASRVQVVVATDLAARGIDVVQLPAVVNYDLPRSAVDYVHRIGRTGRAGESGVALSFVSADSEAHFRLIEKRQGLNVPRERVAGFEPVETLAPAQGLDPAGGIKGKRPSKKDKLRAARASSS